MSLSEQEVLGQRIIDFRKENPTMTASQCQDRLTLIEALENIRNDSNVPQPVNNGNRSH